MINQVQIARLRMLLDRVGRDAVDLDDSEFVREVSEQLPALLDCAERALHLAFELRLASGSSPFFQDEFAASAGWIERVLLAGGPPAIFSKPQPDLGKAVTLFNEWSRGERDYLLKNVLEVLRQNQYLDGDTITPIGLSAGMVFGERFFEGDWLAEIDSQ